MTTEQLLEYSNKYIMETYRRLPVLWREGAGVYLFDNNGKKYLDLLGGLAVCALGHSHPKLAAAIGAQAKRLMHTSNLYHTEAQVLYAKSLVESSFADKVFFCNSGAEANEAAIKLARKYGNTVLGGKNEIITMYQSFHGRTLATITATGQEKFQKGFEPLPSGFTYARFDDIASVKACLSNKTCAIMIEPIQAEGGVIVPSPNYLQALRELCDKCGILLIFDEVQTGMGRTGTLFAYEGYGIKPDILTLAKGLGGGFPVGAMLASQKASVFGIGEHASTFGGNPLAMTAAAVTLETIKEENLLQNCREVGTFLSKELAKLKGKFPLIQEVRGKGLLLGIELKIEAATLVQKCFERRVIIGTAGTKVLRLAPPLIISLEEAKAGLAALTDALQETEESIL